MSTRKDQSSDDVNPATVPGIELMAKALDRIGDDLKEALPEGQRDPIAVARFRGGNEDERLRRAAQLYQLDFIPVRSEATANIRSGKAADRYQVPNRIAVIPGPESPESRENAEPEALKVKRLLGPTPLAGNKDSWQGNDSLEAAGVTGTDGDGSSFSIHGRRAPIYVLREALAGQLPAGSGSETVEATAIIVVSRERILATRDLPDPNGDKYRYRKECERNEQAGYVWNQRHRKGGMKTGPCRGDCLMVEIYLWFPAGPDGLFPVCFEPMVTGGDYDSQRLNDKQPRLEYNTLSGFITGEEGGQAFRLDQDGKKTALSGFITGGEAGRAFHLDRCDTETEFSLQRRDQLSLGVTLYRRITDLNRWGGADIGLPGIEVTRLLLPGKLPLNIPEEQPELPSVEPAADPALEEATESWASSLIDRYPIDAGHALAKEESVASRSMLGILAAGRIVKGNIILAGTDSDLGGQLEAPEEAKPKTAVNRFRREVEEAGILDRIQDSVRDRFVSVGHPSMFHGNLDLRARIGIMHLLLAGRVARLVTGDHAGDEVETGDPAAQL